MPTKDVRVRLSAEGMQEVIKAFERVQAEANKSKQVAKDASKGFDQLGDSVRSLAKEFLAYEAAIKVFELIKGGVEHSLEFAASLGKLQEKTGLSATALQVWAAAAKRADVDQQAVSKGLGLFSKAMGNLEQGSTKASVSLQLLLGSSKALSGLTADEKLHKVTDALSKMSAGSQRAKITTDLFGKAGLELLPVIDQLGGEGFDKLSDKLRAFGALLDDNAIQQAKIAEENLGDLEIAAKGLATQFTIGLLPSINSLAGGLVSLATNADNVDSPIKTLGQRVGETTEKMLYGALYAAVYIEKLGRLAIATEKVLWGAGLSQFKKDLAETNSLYDQATQAIFAMQDAGKKAADQANKDAADEVAAAKKLQGVHDKEIQNAADLAKAKSAAERLAHAKTALAIEQAQAVLSIDKETNQQAAAFEKERFALGVESVTQYYATRRSLAAAMALEEKNAINAQIAAQQSALAKEKDPAKRVELQKAIAQLQAKADVERIQAEGKIETMILEEQAEREKLAAGVLSFEDKMLEAQGKRHEIELASIQKETDAYRKQLTQAGDPNAKAKTDEFQKVLTQQADYKEANRQLEESEKKLGEARRKITSEAERGNISQAEAKRELRSLDQQWQPVLEKQLATLRQIAKTSGLAPLISDADEAREKVDDLNASLNKTKDSNKDLEKQFAKSIGHDLHEFLDRGSKDSDTLGKSFQKLALGVAASFVSMLSQMMAKKSAAKLGGDGGGDSDGGGFLSFMSGLQKHDSGGEITRGPRGRDRVPSWLTRGEFVVREPVVAQPGMRQLLNAINQGTNTPALVKSSGPHFHTGGEVSGGFVLGGGGHKGGKAELTVGLDHGLLLKSLSAHPEFGNIVVKHLGDNRKAANSALGK